MDADDHLETADARLTQDADGVILSIDAIDSDVFGWPVDQLIGTRAPMMVHPDDRDVAWKVRTRVRSSLEPQSIQIRVRAHSGRWLWVDCAFTPIADEHGRMGHRTVLELRDVSARYLHDEALQLLVDLRGVFDAAPTLDDALRQGLARLGLWGGFDAAGAWLPVDATWSPRVFVSCGATDDAVPGTLVSVRSVASAAAEQRATWVDVSDRDHRVRRVLLVPVVAAGSPVAVIELLADLGAEIEGTDGLVVDIVQHLGDAVRRRRIESDLALARQRFELAFDEAAIGMALVAPDGAFIDANASLCRLLGREHAELASIGFQAVTHPDDLEADLEYVRQMLAGERSTYQMEKRYLRPDGSVIWGLLSVSLVRDKAGDPVHFISQIQDITARKRAEEELANTVDQLKRNERRYRSLVEPSDDVISRVTVDGTFLDVNRRAASAFGRAADEIVGRNIADIVPTALATPLLDRVSRVASTGRPVEMWRQWLEPADRDPGWFVIRLMPEEPDESGRVEHIHIVASDITELVENEQRLSAMALVDPLTGLSNRAAVFDRLQHALDRIERRTGSGVGVAVIDLDHFKAINDTFGHAAGDHALQVVGEVLRGAVRAGDTVGRLGGDEFIVVFEDVADRAAASELGERAHRALISTSIDVSADHRHSVSASIGVAFTGTPVAMNDLIARADRAMYLAKSHGRGRSWAEGDGNHEHAGPSSSSLLRELTAALSKHEFELHYQPIASAADGGIVAFEALLRWRNPARGLVPPSLFLNALFSTGQIGPVGHWVIRTAVQQLAEWQRCDATADLRLHVNASPAELAYPGFARTLRDELQGRGVDPARLCIEITEQALANSVVSTSSLAEIASTGVQLVLDDFGTGVSSLSHLRTRPLAGIKIDRSFITGAETDSRERAIAESVVVLGQALDITITAEGVETAEQAEWIRGTGCHYLQGWHIGHPVRASEATDLVLAGTASATV